MSPRKIAVFTGNRAEYGLQMPILRAISTDHRLRPYLFVGGAHLEEQFGTTRAEIEADGFEVFGQVDSRMTQDTLFGTVQAIGSGVLSLSSQLNTLRPDLLVVYADRYESFAAMIAGTQMNIPTAHIEGGDYTEGGALDDSVRHAMTKLAHLHFTTNEQASERIRRLGEEPWRIHTVGLPVLDLVKEGRFATPEETRTELGLDPGRPVVLFCQHSVTTAFDQAEAQIAPSLEALDVLARDGYQVIVTYPNNDAGGATIIDQIERWAPTAGSRLRLVKSLGRHRFHGVLNLIGRDGGAMVGNSSAGIKETAMFGCPVVNVGSRQQGRLRGANVLDTAYDATEIVAAVRRSVEDDSLRQGCRDSPGPYGAGGAGVKVASVLATVPLDERLLRKRLSY